MERYFKRIRSSSSSTSDNAGNGRESSSGNASKPLEKPRVLDDNNTQTDIMDEWYEIQLNASVDVCRFLLNGAIPCGGHDESEESRSKELFVNTLNFIRGCSDVMRNFQLRNGPVNHEVIVPSIRNNIAISFAQEVLKVIFEDIGDNVFAVLLNELRDEYEDVQISMVLRYVDARGLVKERFVGLIEVIDTSALSLKSRIESLFAEYGLSLKLVRGQSYERLSDMRGEFNGLKDLILRENSSAYYVPCFAQQLHVVVVVIAIVHTDAWNFFQNIAILMNVVCGICKPKDMIRESHKERVEKAIGNVEIGTKSWFLQGSYRNQLGTTDWSSIYKTLLHLVDLFPSVVTVLEYIFDACDNSSSQNQAADVQEYFESFDFVFYLHLMLHILELTDLLSQALQKKDQDISEVASLVKSTKQELQKCRASGLIHF